MANLIEKKESKLPDGYIDVILEFLPNYSSRQDVARLNDLWFLEEQFNDKNVPLAVMQWNEMIDLENELYEEAAIARLQVLFTTQIK